MTNKLFWTDPYRRACDTVVAAVDGAQITLRETVFFAFSGGPESDRGTINGRPVIEARKLGTEIPCQLYEAHGLRPGDPVRVEIDWEGRYRLMRLHFAAELVLEIVTRALPGVQKVGAHIAEDKARIDFEWPTSIAPRLPEFAQQAQALIDRDLPITSAFSDPATERRYWELPGFARVACGGTHLRRSGEVGTLSLQRRNVAKGKERIEMLAAAPAGQPAAAPVPGASAAAA